MLSVPQMPASPCKPAAPRRLVSPDKLVLGRLSALVWWHGPADPLLWATLYVRSGV